MQANKPLRWWEVKQLPLGFTPTSNGRSRNQINKEVDRIMAEQHTNRKRTGGRNVQYITVVRKDEDGVPMIGDLGKVITYTKQILHRRAA